MLSRTSHRKDTFFLVSSMENDKEKHVCKMGDSQPFLGYKLPIFAYSLVSYLRRIV